MKRVKTKDNSQKKPKTVPYMNTRVWSITFGLSVTVIALGMLALVLTVTIMVSSSKAGDQYCIRSNEFPSGGFFGRINLDVGEREIKWKLDFMGQDPSTVSKILLKDSSNNLLATLCGLPNDILCDTEVTVGHNHIGGLRKILLDIRENVGFYYIEAVIGGTSHIAWLHFGCDF